MTGTLYSVKIEGENTVDIFRVLNTLVHDKKLQKTSMSVLLFIERKLKKKEKKKSVSE